VPRAGQSDKGFAGAADDNGTGIADLRTAAPEEGTRSYGASWSPHRKNWRRWGSPQELGPGQWM